MVYLSLGVMPFVVEALPASMAPEHRMARRAVLHRRGDDDHPVPGRRRRPVSRYLFPEEHARPQDHHRHQGGHAVFSHVVRALYFGSLSGVGDLPIWATGPAIVLAIAGTSLAPFVHRAHDRPRLSAVDARDHFRHQLRLSGPRRVAALARLRPASGVPPTGSPRRCARSMTPRARAACVRCAQDRSNASSIVLRRAPLESPSPSPRRRWS